MTTTTTLNQGQQAFYETVIGGDFNNLLLLGEAGSGKTFTIVYTISKLLEAEKTVIVAAPTHSALNTIKACFSEEMLEHDNLTFTTVASLLMRFGMRTAGGDTIFRRPCASSILDSIDYAFIDEISMISEAEQKQLLLCSAKTVLTGDLAQIPVVMQRKAEWSEFDDDLLLTMLLTEQERQHSEIYSLALMCRSEIYYPTAADANASDCLNLVDTTESLLAEMLSAMQQTNNPDNYKDFRFLTYRNREVEFANSFFHKALFGSEMPFYEGEFIMLRSTGHYGYNGEITKIREVIGVSHSETFGVDEWTVEISNGSYIKLLSIEDSKKILYKVEYVKSLLKRELDNKNYEAVEQLNKELDLLEGSWVNWQYTYSTTIHKSQGQSIINVFLDISTFKRASNKRALLYVGISRAVKLLTFTTLPPRYKPQRKNKKPNLKMWKCTVTNYVSTGAGLAKYQRKNGICTSMREFVGIKAPN